MSPPDGQDVAAVRDGAERFVGLAMYTNGSRFELVLRSQIDFQHVEVWTLGPIEAAAG
jgi:hypothetical protein